MQEAAIDHAAHQAGQALTQRQAQILALIQDCIARNGAPPTRAEIAATLGYKSANAAEDHLRALARKGAIELLSGASRGIRLRREELQCVNAARGTLLSLPLVGRVAAGAPLLAQEHVEHTYRVDSSLFQRPPDYLLRVRGQSMRDAGILAGDLLAVQRCNEAHSGQIIVARLFDEVTVKRFVRRLQQIELQAENPDYPSMVVQEGDSFAIEGLVVGLIRSSLSGSL